MQLVGGIQNHHFIFGGTISSIPSSFSEKLITLTSFLERDVPVEFLMHFFIYSVSAKN